MSEETKNPLIESFLKLQERSTPIKANGPMPISGERLNTSGEKWKYDRTAYGGSENVMRDETKKLGEYGVSKLKNSSSLPDDPFAAEKAQTQKRADELNKTQELRKQQDTASQLNVPLAQVNTIPPKTGVDRVNTSVGGYQTKPAPAAIPPKPAMDTAPQPQTGSDNVANVIKNAAANRSASALGGFSKVTPDVQGTSSFSGMPKTNLGATSPEGFIKRMSGVEKANPVSSVGKLESGSLKVGSRGDDVKALQKRLGVEADGIFGPKTAAALKSMQQSAGLKADSVYGKQSASYLDRKDALSKLRSENPIGAKKMELGTEFDKADRSSGINRARLNSAEKESGDTYPGFNSYRGRVDSTNDALDNKEVAANDREAAADNAREIARKEQKFKQGIREEDSTMTNKLIDSFLKLQATNSSNLFEAAKKAKKLDPVGKEDEDIDNDGDKDKSDGYLHNRRKAIKAAMKEATDPNAEGIAKPGEKAPKMVPKPDYPTSKPGPTRELKGSLPKGVTVKGNTNEEVEQIDEALSAEHKTAIKAHVKGMWGRGEVAFGSQGGKDFVSHSDGIQKHVHSIHYKKGVPHVTHFLSMDEEVEYIDEAAVPDSHKQAMKKTYGAGVVKINKNRTISHKDRYGEENTHAYNPNNKQPIGRHLSTITVQEDVEFSEAELTHIAAILEANPVAPVADDYSGAAGGVSKRDLSDETVAEEKKTKKKTTGTTTGTGRPRGRPMGSKSGSKHGSGGDTVETKNLASQIRFSRPSGGNFMLKHPTTGVTKAVPAKAATEFYSKYSGAEKPAEKEAHHDAFLTKHFGSSEKPKTGITLPKMPAPKS
ncbi:MAG: hypothetical protein [Caudoviricetes sp.]|nr:MAG: hypothetical protein [Caudoviricetes sp.]